MLSHLYRFHGHGSLRYLYRHGKNARSQTLGLRYIENPHRVHSRFAVVVSKKVYKSAVKRNRLRRRIYEIIRIDLDRIKAPYDIVVTVFNPELLVMSSQELREEVFKLLEKEQLIS